MSFILIFIGAFPIFILPSIGKSGDAFNISRARIDCILKGDVMNQIFPYANIVTGILILIVGFLMHWIGQLVSVISWNFATRIGLQEKGMPKEFKVYEHAIAIADVAIGWIYGIAAIGLILNTPWSYKLIWIPGSLLIYHGISAWFWFGNQNKIGRRLSSDSFRVVWCSANLITGILAVSIAWQAARGTS